MNTTALVIIATAVLCLTLTVLLLVRWVVVSFERRTADLEANYDRMATGRSIDWDLNAARMSAMTQSMTEFCSLSDYKCGLERERLQQEHDRAMAERGIQPDEPTPDEYQDEFPDQIIPMSQAGIDEEDISAA